MRAFLEYGGSGLRSTLLCIATIALFASATWTQDADTEDSSLRILAATAGLFRGSGPANDGPIVAGAELLVSFSVTHSGESGATSSALTA